MGNLTRGTLVTPTKLPSPFLCTSQKHGYAYKTTKWWHALTHLAHPGQIFRHAKIDLACKDALKVVSYVTNMYACRIFTDLEMMKWERSKTAVQEWVATTTCFDQSHRSSRRLVPHPAMRRHLPSIPSPVPMPGPLLISSPSYADMPLLGPPRRSTPFARSLVKTRAVAGPDNRSISHLRPIARPNTRSLVHPHVILCGHTVARHVAQPRAACRPLV